MGKFNAPLYEKIKAHAQISERFHMPMHCGKNLDGFLFASAAFDFTELSFSDNLAYPMDVIKEAEMLAAKSFESRDVLFFTSGATSAIFTAFKTLSESHSSVLVDSFSHKSVFNAARSFIPDIYLLKRKYDTFGFPLAVDLGELDSALKKTGAKLFSLTSPDYFGRVSDLQEIQKICHARGVTLFADASHGAHFSFCSSLPPAPAKFCDMAVLSMHKTMPVYTGGAALSLNGNFSYEKAARVRGELCTTSPSYVTLCSMDYARALYDEKGEEILSSLNCRVKDFKKKIGSDAYFENDDFTRLILRCDASNLEKEDIYCEMTRKDFSLFLMSPFAITSGLFSKLSGLRARQQEDKTSGGGKECNQVSDSENSKINVCGEKDCNQKCGTDSNREKDNLEYGAKECNQNSGIENNKQGSDTKNDKLGGAGKHNLSSDKKEPNQNNHIENDLQECGTAKSNVACGTKGHSQVSGGKESNQNYDTDSGTEYCNQSGGVKSGDLYDTKTGGQSGGVESDKLGGDAVRDKMQNKNKEKKRKISASTYKGESKHSILVIKNELAESGYMHFELPEKLEIIERAKTEFVPLEKAEGRLIAVDIGTYPPGVPIAFKGERLKREKLDFLKDNIKNTFNMESEKICVIIE